MDRRATWTILAFAAAWHALSLLVAVQKSWGQGIGDFASYYYAFQAAISGADPYAASALSLARGGGGVHPYFYPPPFLLLVAPFGLLPPKMAYAGWFLFDEACALAVVAVLWRWWGRTSPIVGPAAAVVTALCTSIPNNHWMGQANLPVLLVALLGLWAEDEDHPWLGGALVGVACMWKMSPALLVVAWLVRGRWRPAAAAVIAAIGLSIATLPILGPASQWVFYARVLPGFSSGTYNGLTIPISLYGNHSIPNLFDGLFPNSGPGLSRPARLLSTASGLALVIATFAGFGWRGTRDWKAEISALAALMLLVPVYTYEHHVVWAIPAVLLGIREAWAGRLPAWVQAVLGVSIAIWAFELADLKQVSQALRLGPLPAMVRELKFLALCGLFGTSFGAAVGLWAEDE